MPHQQVKRPQRNFQPNPKRRRPRGRYRRHYRNRKPNPNPQWHHEHRVQNQTSRDVRLINALLFVAGILYYFVATGKLQKFVDAFVR